MPVSVYQNHGLGTKGVVEILVQTGARIELPQIVGKSIAIRIDIEIVKVPIEDGSAVVELTLAQCSPRKSTVLRGSRPSIAVSIGLCHLTHGAIEAISTVHLNRHFIAQEISITWNE